MKQDFLFAFLLHFFYSLDNQKASLPALDPPSCCFANVPPLLLFKPAFRFDRTAALFAISWLFEKIAVGEAINQSTRNAC